MGYAAEQIQGEPIVITNAIAFWAALKAAANGSNYPDERRFSWTETTDYYDNLGGLTNAQKASAMLEHYGFSSIDTQGRTIVLNEWGGDKIGSSWDDIWEVIARHAEPYRWVMAGEDGFIWCEDNPSQQRRQRDLNLDLAFPS